VLRLAKEEGNVWQTICTLGVVCGCSLAAAAEREVAEPVVAEDPDPDRLPSLSVHKVEWTPGRTMTMVRIKAPSIPDFECDVWCYESAIEPGEAEAGAHGSVTLRQHTTRENGHVIVTRVVPEEGAVSFEVSAEVAGEADVRNLPGVNPCWQLRRAAGFSSAGAPYPEFVARCFLFTDDGCVTMDKTERFPDTRRPADDERNNPPWVQVYIPVWRPHPGQPEAFWGNSTDRYLYPLLGCLSRDGKHLVAMGTDSNRSMGEGWHDCLHVNPTWGPFDPDTGRVACRFKLYLMENDPEALLKRFAADLPEGMQLKEGRVPEG
jgi:hypothetical protein